MKIKECNIIPFKTLRMETPVSEIADILRKEEQPLIVVDETGEPVGIISFVDVIKVFLPHFLELIDDPDILKNLGMVDILKEKKRAYGLTAKDIMSSPIRTVDGEDSVLSAIAKMKKRMQRQLAVMDGGKLVGFITAREILTEIIVEALDGIA